MCYARGAIRKRQIRNRLNRLGPTERDSNSASPLPFKRLQKAFARKKFEEGYVRGGVRPGKRGNARVTGDSVAAAHGPSPPTALDSRLAFSYSPPP